jgi:apolipoprotein N-acyltransferase
MKKNIPLSMLCGILAALALPPFFYCPLGISGFSGLYLLLQKSNNTKQSFWRGWSFGFAHHVVGLYWISNSLLVDADRFAWLIPFAVSLIPAAAAVYIGLVAALYKKIALTPSPLPKGEGQSIIYFVILWVIAEYLRAHLFTGFPWNLMGYAFNIADETMQAAHIVSIYGLSFLFVLAATAPALLLQKQRLIVIVCTLLFPAMLYGYGYQRLVNAPQASTDIPIRIVQANIVQNQKWDDATRMQGFIKHLELSRGAKSGAVIIWPETSVPFFLNEEPEARAMIGKVIGKTQTLVTGTLRAEREGEYLTQLWNSMEVLQKGEIVATYDKARLVPFGEFVPLRRLFPFVEKITHGSIDFSSGKGATTLALSDIPAFSPLICYEIIYPDYHPQAGAAKWILNG